MTMPDKQTRRGLLIILSSPSGAGKSTLSKKLMEWDPTMRFSISATTRTPRSGEQEGKDYYFLSKEDFAAYVRDGEMLEYAEVFGNLYGSPRGPVTRALEAGRDVLFDVDWQGAQQIRNSPLGRDVLSIFILPPSIAELERRLRFRGQDSDETIRKRMLKSKDEISHWAEYDYVLVNQDLKETEEKIQRIIGATRLRRDTQPQLSDFVRQLNREFDAR
jgi:guanylate kinase